MHREQLARQVPGLDSAELSPTETGAKCKADNERLRFRNAQDGLKLEVVQAVGRRLLDARHDAPRERGAFDIPGVGGPAEEAARIR
jgi:hypothetical protein